MVALLTELYGNGSQFSSFVSLAPTDFWRYTGVSAAGTLFCCASSTCYPVVSGSKSEGEFGWGGTQSTLQRRRPEATLTIDRNNG